VTKNNAFALLDILNRFGERIYKLRYQLETATINSIVAEWEEKHSDKISQLQLIDWVNELKTSNQNFNNKYIARTVQLSEVETGVLAYCQNSIYGSLPDTEAAYRGSCPAYPECRIRSVNGKAQQSGKPI
jgi:hypothetical protein